MPPAVRHRIDGYYIWQSMIQRCTNPRRKEFKYYGGRGIDVCEAWKKSFEKFLEDMGPRPSKTHWIERLDNNIGYFPGNCVWSTIYAQSRNKSNSRKMTFLGRTMVAADWAREFGLKPVTLTQRLLAGWDFEKALTTPVAKRRVALEKAEAVAVEGERTT